MVGQNGRIFVLLLTLHLVSLQLDDCGDLSIAVGGNGRRDELLRRIGFAWK